LTHINILAELFCDGGQWEAALGVVQRAERELLDPGEELPIDLKVCGALLCSARSARQRAGQASSHSYRGPLCLPVASETNTWCPCFPHLVCFPVPSGQVKAGAAHAYLGQVEQAADALSAVLQEPVEAYADLYMDASDVMLTVGEPAQALPFLTCACPLAALWPAVLWFEVLAARCRSCICWCCRSCSLLVLLPFALTYLPACLFTIVLACRALAEHPDVSTPEVWEHLAACHRSLHNMDAALTVSERLPAVARGGLSA
jgi:hypothetical protein